MKLDPEDISRPIPLDPADLPVGSRPIPLDPADLPVGAKPIPLDPADLPVGSRPIPLDPADLYTPAGGEIADTYQKQRAEIQEVPWYGNWGETKNVTDKDIQAIADKRGVPAAQLKDWAPYLQARSDDPSLGESLKYVAGFAQEAVGFGVPQKLAIESQDPKLRDALDDLRELAQARKGGFVRAAEIVTPGSLVRGAKAVTRLATTAIGGAITGAAGSRHGEEVPAAFLGSFLGLGAGAAAEGIGKALQTKATRLAADAKVKSMPVGTNEAERTFLDSLPKATQAEIGDMAEATLAKSSPIDNAVRKQLERTATPEDYQAVARSLPREDLEALRKTWDIPDSQPNTAQILETLGEQATTTKTRQFLEAHELPSDSRKIIQETIDSIHGTAEADPRRLVQRFDTWNRANAELDALSTARVKHDSILSPFLQTVQRTVSGFPYVTEAIDRKLGTSFTRRIRELPEALNRFSHARKEALDGLQKGDLNLTDLISDTSRAKLNGEQVSQLIESGDIGKLDIAQRKVVEQWQSLFERARQIAERSDDVAIGLQVPRRERYVPSRLKEAYEIASTVEQTVADMQRKYNIPDLRRADPATLETISRNDPTMAQLAEAFQYLTGVQRNKILTPDLVQAGLEAAQSPRVQHSLQTKAMAVHARELGVPDLIRERDVAKLFQGWVQQTLRHKYLRQPIEQMKHMSDLVRKYGDDVTATRLDNMVMDLTGAERRRVAIFAADKVVQIRKGFLNKAAQAPEGSLERSAFQTLAKFPDVPSYIMQQVHANLLGYSLKSILQNLSQVPSMVGPRLGAFYGPQAILGGLRRIGNPKHFREISQKLDRLGLEAVARDTDIVPWIEEGIRSSTGARLTRQAIKKQAEVGMYLYSLSDKINRVATYDIATQMVKDMVGGGKVSARARKALSNMPTSTQRVVLRSLQKGDVAAAEKELASSLISITQFHYNKATMSEVGRSLGPIFSIFSTWPTMIAGDMLTELETRGVLRGTIKNLARWAGPLTIYMGVNMLLAEQGLSEDPRVQAALGKGGVTSWAPGAAAGDLGGIASPLLADLAIPYGVALGNFLASGNYMDPEEYEALADRMAKASGRVAWTLLPAAGLTKLVTKTGPTLITGEKTNLLDEITGD